MTPRDTPALAKTRGNERGVALLEVALVLPVVLVLTLAAVDFGRAFFTQNIVEQSAREGCRLAVVTDPDTAMVRQRVNQVCGAAGVSARSLTVQGPDANGVVTVRVEVNFAWVAPGLLRFVGVDVPSVQTLRGQTAMRFEG